MLWGALFSNKHSKKAVDTGYSLFQVFKVHLYEEIY